MKAKLAVACVLVALFLAAFAAQALLGGADTSQALAREILRETGVTGGLIVHLGCGDGKLTAALRASDSYLVHGLDADPRNVQKAREYILSRGLYGPVAVDRLAGRRLPYVDNLVNLVVAEDLGQVSMSEVLRVLAPNGVAYVRRGRAWSKTVKPRPAEIDEWTHYLHDATNNAVAQDTVIGPPRHLQWIGGPRYSRHHDHMSSISAMVSAGGRVFYIFDHASPLSIELPSKWFLVARDAFNGTILWKRPIAKWHTQMFRLKSGPAQLTRRLVAVGDRVYVTLGLNAPVSALDAATGKTVRVYPRSENTEEIIFSDGVLFLVVNDNPFEQPANPAEYRYTFVEGPRRVMAVEADTGKILWDKPMPDVLPMSLAADSKHVYFDDGQKIVCLDRTTGAEIWHTPPVERRKEIPTFFGPTLVVYDGVVLYSGGSVEPDTRNAGGGTNTMYAFDAQTGKLLWTAEHPPSGYKSPEDILVLQGLVWTPATTFGTHSGEMIGRDPHTGEIKKRFLPDVETHWFHHRCYRAKATERYILTSRTGIEFVDPKAEHWICHHWVRGGCLYGIMPANGMVYNPPHPCACYIEAKLYGFNALAPASPSRRRLVRAGLAEERLERGPAYGAQLAAQEGPEDWPTYRCDEQRSGCARTALAPQIRLAWERKLGGKLSSVVVAEGKVFLASVDTHTVYAFAADSGRELWRFVAGGRVDSPPTIWRGRVLFGSADGYVYCLRASDGQLVWRFRAAPADLRLVSFQQVESVWPVHGSVLVHDGVVYCVAGRSAFLDGGMRLLRINANTGELVGEKVIDERVPGTRDNLQVMIKGLNMPVALPDILSCDGEFVYMRSQRFDLAGERQELELPTLDVKAQKGPGVHLFSPTGFLDDIWWHRSYWIYGRVFKSGAGGYYQAGRFVPAGRPLVFDDTHVYGYGRKPQYYRWTTPMEYQLFATTKQPELVPLGTSPFPRKRRRGGVGQQPAQRIATEWTLEVPVLVRAMVLAGDALFLAGPPDVVDEVQAAKTFGDPKTQQQLARQAAAFEGSEGALLWVVSTKGEKLAEYKLKSVPAFDSMAAAQGRLYFSTIDGKLVCYASAR